MSDHLARELARRADAGEAGARVELEKTWLDAGLGWRGEQLPRVPGKGRLVPKHEHLGVYHWLPQAPEMPTLEFVHVPTGTTFVPTRSGLVEFDVPEFWMARYPVTSEEFLAVLGASDRMLGRMLQDGPGQPGTPPDRPAVWVSPRGARTFAEILGLSLPSEARWRRAAFGGREQAIDCPNCAGMGSEAERLCQVCEDATFLVPRTWPWGEEEPDDSRCVLACQGGRQAQADLLPVKKPGWRPIHGRPEFNAIDRVPTRPKGASWCGMQDAIGNVAEFLDDTHEGSTLYVECGAWNWRPERRVLRRLTDARRWTAKRGATLAVRALSDHGLGENDDTGHHGFRVAVGWPA